jgi:hypothetical protein
VLRTKLHVLLDHKKVSVVALGGAAAPPPEADERPAPGPVKSESPRPRAEPTSAEPIVRPVPSGAAEPDEASPSAGPRVAVHAIAFRDMRGESEAEVVLRHSRREAMGIARGSGTGLSGARLVASATAHALERFLDSRHRIEVGEVKQVDLGDRSAVLVTVSVNAGRDEYLLLGSCWVFEDLKRATVYAVLDATNRVIGRLQGRQYVDYEIVGDQDVASDRGGDARTP